MQPDPNREIPVGLTPQELDTIFQGLGQLPYFRVVNLIEKLKHTVLASMNEPPAEAPTQSEG